MMAEDSFSSSEQRENISWASSSAAIGRRVSSPQLTLIIWKKEDFANIIEEVLLLYKTKYTEICLKSEKTQLPGFKYSVQGLLHKM